MEYSDSEYMITHFAYIHKLPSEQHVDDHIGTMRVSTQGLGYEVIWFPVEVAYKVGGE